MRPVAALTSESASPGQQVEVRSQTAYGTWAPEELTMADPCPFRAEAFHVDARGIREVLDGSPIKGGHVVVVATNVGHEPARFYATLWGYEVRR